VVVGQQALAHGIDDRVPDLVRGGLETHVIHQYLTKRHVPTDTHIERETDSETQIQTQIQAER
jgi:hypothetical protein